MLLAGSNSRQLCQGWGTARCQARSTERRGKIRRQVRLRECMHRLPLWQRPNIIELHEMAQPPGSAAHARKPKGHGPTREPPPGKITATSTLPPRRRFNCPRTRRRGTCGASCRAARPLLSAWRRSPSPPPRSSPGPRPRVPCHTFTNFSALVHALCKATIQVLFNFLPCTLPHEPWALQQPWPPWP